MRKLLYTGVLLLLGLVGHAQSEAFVTVGHLQGMEFIGDDIKNGVASSLGANIDFFGKKTFDFGLTTSVHLLGELQSDIEFLESEEVAAAGLHMGFSTKKTSLKAMYQLPVFDEDPFFRSVASLKLTTGKHRALGWSFGVDYFFNRHIFHYTYSINTGISIKL